jgi:hypothetical protein
MAITAPLTYPFFTGGAKSTDVPAIWDVALDGRGYLLDLESNQFRHQSIPLIRQQADTSDTPGEQSLNPEDLWRRSIDSWHQGAGQTYYDANDSNEAQYHTSKGIDPWTRGQVSLLHDTAQKRASANTNVQVVACGDRLYLLDGDTLAYTTDVTAGTVSWTFISYDFDNAHSVASDGFYVWVVDDTDIWYVTRSDDTVNNWAGTPTRPGTLVSYAKGRLFVANGSTVTNLFAQGVTDVDDIDADTTGVNPDWTWTDIAAGETAIYLAGYSGDKSLIYRTAFDDATGSLSSPTVAAVIPDGEIVRSLQGYLGFLLIGTDKGVRFAVAGGNGDLQLGDLIPTSPVQCFEPQDRFVWFGWTDYDDTSTGLGRIDLRTLNGTQPAYASDLMAATQGDVTSVVTFQNLRVFTVAGDGVWVQSSDYVYSGEITSGLIGFRLSTSKTALYLETQHRKGAGEMQAAVSADEGTFVSVGRRVTTTANSSGVSSTVVGQLRGELFEIKHTLYSDNYEASPVLGRTTLRVDPQAPRRERITLPIVLMEYIESDTGVVRRMDVAAEFARLRALATTRLPVSLQIGRQTYTVIVEDFEFVTHENVGDASFAFSGVMNTVVKTV